MSQIWLMKRLYSHFLPKEILLRVNYEEIRISDKWRKQVEALKLIRKLLHSTEQLKSSFYELMRSKIFTNNVGIPQWLSQTAVFILDLTVTSPCYPGRDKLITRMYYFKSQLVPLGVQDSSKFINVKDRQTAIESQFYCLLDKGLWAIRIWGFSYCNKKYWPITCPWYNLLLISFINNQECYIYISVRGELKRLSPVPRTTQWPPLRGLPCGLPPRTTLNNQPHLL